MGYEGSNTYTMTIVHIALVVSFLILCGIMGVVALVEGGK